MATGYTNVVQDGTVTDLRTFALRCARAFGACITQREESMDEPPRPRSPDGHYQQCLDRARERLAELRTQSKSQQHAAFDRAVANIREENKRSRKRCAEVLGRYEAMITQVQAWEPPTREHKELKAFMLSQLHESVEHDTKPFVVHEPSSPEALWSAEIESATRDVEYYTSQVEAERRRCENSAKWINALFDSLPKSPARRNGA